LSAPRLTFALAATAYFLSHSVTRVRRVSSVTIRLSKVELDPTDPGYQAPAPLSDGQIADPTAAAAAAAALYALAEAARPAATVVSSATANAVGLAIDTTLDVNAAGGAASALICPFDQHRACFAPFECSY
jgi:hypothetical protein